MITEVIKLIDLHLHSTCSDGQDTPEELVKIANELREKINIEMSKWEEML